MKENLTNTRLYVASKYSHKYWRCIPKYRAWLFDGLGSKNARIKPTLVPEVSWYNCAVCNVNFHSGSEGLSTDHLVESDDCYYCVPAFHTQCRDMIALNPLAYYED